MDFKTKKKDEASMDLTPLIDVIFILVIFLLVTTTFVESQGIQVNLPKSDTNDVTAQAKDVTISISNDGVIYYNKQAVSKEELGAKFKDAHSSNPETLVIIKGDEKVSHGIVVEVMDAARSAGLLNLAIATEPKG